MDIFFTYNGSWCIKRTCWCLLVRWLVKVFTEIKFCLSGTTWKTPLHFAMVNADAVWTNESPYMLPMKDILIAPSSWGLHALYTLCLYLLIRGLCHLVYNYIDLCSDASWTCTSTNWGLRKFIRSKPHSPHTAKTSAACTKLCWSRTTLMLLCAVSQHWQCNSVFLMWFPNKNIQIISQIQMKSAPQFGVSNTSRDEVCQFARRHTEEGQKKTAVMGFRALTRTSVFLVSIHINQIPL